MRVCRVGEAIEDRVGVVRRVQVLMDRADHPRDGRAVRGAGDERVEVVLRPEGVAHGPITLEDADAADRPVGEAARQDVVDEHRLVGTMEGADAEMDDSG